MPPDAISVKLVGKNFNTPIICGCGFSGELRPGVELKGRPIKRIAESAAVQQRQLRRAQRLLRSGAFFEFVIEVIHQLFGGCVSDFPEAGNDVVGSGAQKSPRQSDQAFSGIGARASAVAGRDGNQIGADGVLNNIAGVELERIGFERAFGKHNRRVEGTQAAGGAVGDKMNL